MTVLEILKKTEDYLRAKRIENPRLDSELLLSHLLKCKRIDLYVNFDKPLNSDETDQFREYVRRRALYEPLQYITGEGHFLGMMIKVGPGALIPRPETEVIMETLINDIPDLSGKSVLDMGTGSGILALYIKKMCKTCVVTACDLSAEALAIAKENARMLDLDITWVQSDMFQNFASGGFDIIMSNPPYIKSRDIMNLEPEVRDHEPRLALDGGDDGLDFYRRFMPEAKDRMNTGCRMYLEFGFGQAETITSIGVKAGLKLDKIVKDIEKRERVAVFIG